MKYFQFSQCFFLSAKIQYAFYVCLTVKVGGMRVVQHKPPTHKENPTADLEDCTGLTVNAYV